MKILKIFALCLIVCCAQISAQEDNCQRLYRSCVQCSGTSGQLEMNRPDACPREVRDRWVWRDVSQCDLQRLYCRNPQRRFTCAGIAQMAGMRRRATGRCDRCATRRRPTRARPTRQRPTRRRTRRPTRRTTRGAPPSTPPPTTTAAPTTPIPTTQATQATTRGGLPRRTTRRNPRKPIIN